SRPRLPCYWSLSTSSHPVRPRFPKRRQNYFFPPFQVVHWPVARPSAHRNNQTTNCRFHIPPFEFPSGYNRSLIRVAGQIGSPSCIHRDNSPLCQAASHLRRRIFHYETPSRPLHAPLPVPDNVLLPPKYRHHKHRPMNLPDRPAG